MADLVDTPEALERAIAILAREPALALDTETDAFFAYRGRICLIQVSVPGHDFLVDPLRDLDLAPFGALLADPARETILHAAENDVILLRHQFGWRIARLFDTQVACFVLGWKPYSLAGILEARFGRKLDKSQQRSDWKQRPLSAEQIAYAAEDTCHLLDLARELREGASGAGRTEEIESECARIAAREWTPEPFDPEGFRRLDRDLRGVPQRILRDLFLFREKEAEKRNRAPYRIAPDAALVALATGASGNPPRGVPPTFWQRYGKDVRRIMEEARRAGPLPPRPPPPRREADPLPQEARDRFERLRRWRALAAEQRGVETFVVAKNELLLKIAVAGCATLDDLGVHMEPFRLREYGEAMLGAMSDSSRQD
ncbi:MAG TPA: HRDC domain-containing protein [Planctomycetota bacterium]|nr:HRDC domain-containing protein [Planctomycetota bacterium]